MSNAEILYLGWRDFNVTVERMGRHLRLKGAFRNKEVIVGEPRGGLPLAVAVSHYSLIPFSLAPKEDEQVIWVDDIVDSGETLLQALNRYGPRLRRALVWCWHSLPELAKISIEDIYFVRKVPKGVWLCFPWEDARKAEYDRIMYLRKRGMDSHESKRP